MILNDRRSKIFFLVVAATIISSVPFFYEIGKLGIQEWDESLFAENAIEMARNNNFITKYTEGSPDLYNTKPPLITWVQVIFIKIFGENVYSLRIPIGISGIMIIYFVFWFFIKEFKNYSIPFIYALLFCTSGAIITLHVGRTGDHDLPLSLFLLGAILTFYLFINYKKVKYLYITTLLLIFAFLTKSVFTFLIIPGLVVSLIYYGQVKEVIKSRHLYYNILFFIISTSAYFILRELDSPGYFKAVWDLDVMRYSTTIDLHKHEFSYYIEDLLTQKTGIGIWKYLLPLSIISIFFYSPVYKRFSVYITFNAFLFLLIISKSETKLLWYQTLFVVLIYINIAVFLFWVINSLILSLDLKRTYQRFLILSLFIISIFTPVYYNCIESIKNIKEHDSLNYGQFITKLDKENKLKGKLTLYAYPWHRQIKYYQKIYKKTSITVPPFESIKAGDTIMMCERSFFEKIMSLYSYEILEEFENCKLVRLVENIGPKIKDITNSGSQIYNYKNLFLLDPILEFDSYSSSKIVARATEKVKGQVFCYGPYIHLDSGSYVAKFKLKTNNNNIHSKIAVLSVGSMDYPNGIIASSPINGSDFMAAGEYNDFFVAFKILKSLEKVEFLIQHIGDFDLVLDHIQLYKIDLKQQQADIYNANNKLYIGPNARVAYDSISYSGIVVSSKNLSKEIISFGPYIEADPGKYRITAYVKTKRIEGVQFNRFPFNLDVYSNKLQRVFYFIDVEFAGKFDVYLPYVIDFSLNEKVKDLEFRIFLKDNCQLSIDYLKCEKISN